MNQFFDTFIEITAYTKTQTEFDKLCATAKPAFAELHALFDAYNSYPGLINIASINAAAGRTPLTVDARLYALVQQCLLLEMQSKGALSPTLGAVSMLWKRYIARYSSSAFEAAVLPTNEELIAAAALTKSTDLVCDPTKNSLFLSRAGMRLDLGAAAKGFATEQVAQLLERAGYSHFAINAGGNLRTSDTPLNDTARWKIGVQSPNDAKGDALITTLSLTDAALATSGDYGRYYDVNGARYHHLIDPSTSMPARNFHSVTVLCHDAGIADLLSTALFCMSYEQGLILCDIYDADALFVTADDRILYSDSFATFME